MIELKAFPDHKIHAVPYRRGLPLPALELDAGAFVMPAPAAKIEADGPGSLVAYHELPEGDVWVKLSGLFVLPATGDLAAVYCVDDKDSDAGWRAEIRRATASVFRGRRAAHRDEDARLFTVEAAEDAINEFEKHPRAAGGREAFRRAIAGQRLDLAHLVTAAFIGVEVRRALDAELAGSDAYAHPYGLENARHADMVRSGREAVEMEWELAKDRRMVDPVVTLVGDIPGEPDGERVGIAVKDRGKAAAAMAKACRAAADAIGVGQTPGKPITVVVSDRSGVSVLSLPRPA